MATLNYTFEELGKNQGACIECEIEYGIIEGEPRTRDYPGSLPYVEFYAVYVTEYTNETEQVFRKDREDLFLLLDEIAFSMLQERADTIQERIFEKEGGWS
jgi:hypothetical protein